MDPVGSRVLVLRNDESGSTENKLLMMELGLKDPF